MNAQRSIKYKVLSNSPSETGIKGRSRQKSILGFTLIELMVAIAIIAVLATVGLVVYSTAQKSGRISKRAQDLEAFRTAIELFKSSTGFYPNLPTGGTIGTFTCITNLTGNNLLTPTYMSIIPADPSDSSYCYQYTSNGTVGGATPNATDYKIRTNPSITADMTSADFAKQPNLIDSDRDGTADDICSIQTGGTITGWAVSSGSSTACNWP